MTQGPSRLNRNSLREKTEREMSSGESKKAAGGEVKKGWVGRWEEVDRKRPAFRSATICVEKEEESQQIRSEKADKRRQQHFPHKCTELQMCEHVHAHTSPIVSTPASSSLLPPRLSASRSPYCSLRHPDQTPVYAAEDCAADKGDGAKRVQRPTSPLIRRSGTF